MLFIRTSYIHSVSKAMMAWSPPLPSNPFLISGLPALVVIMVVFLVITSFLRRRQHNRHYRSIPGPKASSVLGYLLDLHNPNGLEWHFKMTERYGHVAKLDGGIFGSDALYVSDPSALQSILVRDLHAFRESHEFNGLFGIIHHGDGVASVHGEEHRKQRKLIDPIFTTARVSRLTSLFYNVTRQLQAILNAEIAEHPKGREINILDRLVRTTLELIAQAGLGHTFNSFENSDEFKEFHWAITSVLPTASRLFLFLPYFDTWRKLQPVWLRRFLAHSVAFLPWSAPREFKKSCDVMHPVFEKLLEDRKELFRQGGLPALEETATVGADLMTLLFKTNWEAEKEDRMPDDVVIANISGVVHGAQETTSGALSRFICLLAEDSELQARLRDEIRQAREKKGTDEDFDYAELNGLPLLDAVCRETFRLYSPVTFVWRQTVEDTVVPLKFPVEDKTTGALKRELLIKKGTAVYLGLSAANRSKVIWGPDASEFKPGRWMGKGGIEITSSESNRLPGTYSNMMTFLGGPRACPGYRFAILEIKLVLAVLLEFYSFQKSGKDIDWKLYITLTPYVQGEDGEAQAPVRITML